MSVEGSALDVAAALREARAAGVERLDAMLLLARLLDRPRSWLIAHDDAQLDPAQAAGWRDALMRRAAGEPLAYIVGEKEFHGLRLQVDRRVLVPRPETELLVDWALELLAGPLAALAGPRVIDLGTGSGAIAIAVKKRCPRALVVATDASAGSLALAADNARACGTTIDLRNGSWWSAVEPAAAFDLVLSNPPYIAAGDPHLAALAHEPALALTPGGDGLSALAEIVAGAAQRLAPGGWVLLEHGYDQAEAVRGLLARHGCVAPETRTDLAGLARCSGARRA